MVQLAEGLFVIAECIDVTMIPGWPETSWRLSLVNTSEGTVEYISRDALRDLYNRKIKGRAERLTVWVWLKQMEEDDAQRELLINRGR